MKKERCICGKDITGRSGAHPPLWHFYDLIENEHPDNEPWSEYDGIAQAVRSIELSYA